MVLIYNASLKKNQFEPLHRSHVSYMMRVLHIVGSRPALWDYNEERTPSEIRHPF